MNTSEPDISEEFEEELLVYADFDTVIDEAMFQKDPLFKVIGLNEDEPYLQIGTQMYSGKWYDDVGTNLFFEPEPAPPPSDPVFSEVPSTLLNYKYKTRKCLELSRVFVNSKFDDSDNLTFLQRDESADNPATSHDMSTKCETKGGTAQGNYSTEKSTSASPNKSKNSETKDAMEITEECDAKS